MCELLSWITPNGTYKTASCLKLLERLAEEGEVELPHRRACRPSAERAWVFGPATDPSPPLVARLADLELVRLQPVTTRVERDLWQEYVHRYHPLGYSNSASSQTSGVPLCIPMHGLTRDFSYNWNAMRGYHYLVHLAHLLNALTTHSRDLLEKVLLLGVRGLLHPLRQTVSGPWLDAQRIRDRVATRPQLRLA